MTRSPYLYAMQVISLESFQHSNRLCLRLYCLWTDVFRCKICANCTFFRISSFLLCNLLCLVFFLYFCLDLMSSLFRLYSSFSRRPSFICLHWNNLIVIWSCSLCYAIQLLFNSPRPSYAIWAIKTHLLLVPHICVSDSSQHWFR